MNDAFVDVLFFRGESRQRAQLGVFQRSRLRTGFARSAAQATYSSSSSSPAGSGSRDGGHAAAASAAGDGGRQRVQTLSVSVIFETGISTRFLTGFSIGAQAVESFHARAHVTARRITAFGVDARVAGGGVGEGKAATNELSKARRNDAQLLF